MTPKSSKVATPKYTPNQAGPSNQHLDLTLNHTSELNLNQSSHRSSRSSGASFRESLSQVNYTFIFFLAVATLGPLQYGYHISELNAPQDVITCLNPSLAEEVASMPNVKSLPKCIPMNEAAFALLSSMFVLGGFIGAVVSGTSNNMFGRLWTMRATALFFMLGACLETFAANHAMLAAGRFFSGIGAGGSTTVVPIYINESSPPDATGFFGSMTQVTINIGILTTQTLGHFLSRGSLWRIILGVAGCIAVVQLAGLFFVAESPQWLALNRSPTRGRDALLRIRTRGYEIDKEILRWDGGITSPASDSENASLLRNTDSLTSESDIASNLPRPHSPKTGSGGPSFLTMFRDTRYRRAAIAVIGIMFTQQLCGINSIMMYSVSVLRGLLPMDSSIITILLSVANILTTIACSGLPDRIGRKPCLLISIFGMGISSAFLALTLHIEAHHGSAISVLLFVVFFAAGLGPVPFLIASEFVEPDARGPLQSVLLAANYVSTFLVAQFFPLINTGLNKWLGGVGWAYYIFFAFAGLGFLFVWYFVPETKNKTADEAWSTFRSEPSKPPHLD